MKYMQKNYESIERKNRLENKIVFIYFETICTGTPCLKNTLS